jgi:hypothetical protein
VVGQFDANDWFFSLTAQRWRCVADRRKEPRILDVPPKGGGLRLRAISGKAGSSATGNICLPPYGRINR